MGLFGRIFSGREKRIETPLETLLAAITLDQPRQTYHSVKKPELRLPSAVSTLTLHVVHKFCEGLSQMIRNTQRAAGAPDLPFLYDVAAFEAAAYCHYWLMRQYLQVNNDDEGDDDAESDDYFECLKDAAHVTNAVITSRTNFALVDQFLFNRVISYSQRRTKSEYGAPESFANTLVSSLRKGTPGASPKSPDHESLPVALAVTTYIPIFQQTHLEALPKTARALFLADKEGLLE